MRATPSVPAAASRTRATAALGGSVEPVSVQGEVRTRSSARHALAGRGRGGSANRRVVRTCVGGRSGTRRGVAVHGHAARAVWVAEVIIVADEDPMRRTSVGGAAGDWVGGAILDALFTQSPVGLHILDTELRVVRVNAAARGMRGVAVEGLVGLHFAEAYAGLAAPDEVEAMLRGVLESGVPVREHLLCMRVAAEQGREKCGSVSVFRLQDPQGTVLGLAVTAVDVTEQEQARARLRVLNAVRERVGQTLDVIATCQELVEALVPGFADAAMVDIVDAVVHGEESPTGPLAEDVALRRAAFRARDGLQVPSYPVADMRSLNLLRPYAQAMSDLRPRLVPLSPDTSWLDASRARGSAQPERTRSSWRRWLCAARPWEC